LISPARPAPVEPDVWCAAMRSGHIPIVWSDLVTPLLLKRDGATLTGAGRSIEEPAATGRGAE
jgi:hypothetical protein